MPEDDRCICVLNSNVNLDNAIAREQRKQRAKYKNIKCEKADNRTSIRKQKMQMENKNQGEKVKLFLERKTKKRFWKKYVQVISKSCFGKVKDDTNNLCTKQLIVLMSSKVQKSKKNVFVIFESKIFKMINYCLLKREQRMKIVRVFKVFNSLARFCNESDIYRILSYEKLVINFNSFCTDRLLEYKNRYDYFPINSQKCFASFHLFNVKITILEIQTLKELLFHL